MFKPNNVFTTLKQIISSPLPNKPPPHQSQTILSVTSSPYVTHKPSPHQSQTISSSLRICFPPLKLYLITTHKQTISSPHANNILTPRKPCHHPQTLSLSLTNHFFTTDKISSHHSQKNSPPTSKSSHHSQTISSKLTNKQFSRLTNDFLATHTQIISPLANHKIASQKPYIHHSQTMFSPLGNNILTTHKPTFSPFANRLITHKLSPHSQIISSPVTKYLLGTLKQPLANKPAPHLSQVNHLLLSIR